MNATEAIIAANNRYEHAEANRLLREHGRLIGTSPSRVRYWLVGDDVLCSLSYTQIHFAGRREGEPRWIAPSSFEEVAP